MEKKNRAKRYPKNDLIRKRFGRLEVIEYMGRNENYEALWKAECDCGTIGVYIGSCLVRGTTKSCGCLKRDKAREDGTTHGLSHTPEYAIWHQMRQRCLNPKNSRYAQYCKRGICEKWANDFMAFYEDMGPRPTPDHSLDRIDNSQGYTPQNCRWALPNIQQGNRSNNHLLTHGGETKTVSQWARDIGIKPQTIVKRLKRGWSVEKAVTTP